MAKLETKNFALTRKCQVKSVLCDPRGNGAFIKKLPVKNIEPCESCNGTGKDTVCRSCKKQAKPGEVFVEGRIITCTTCKGTGKVENQDCFHCKGTKRSYPPHHYVEVDRDGDLIIEDEEESNRVEELREQIKALDGDYDGRWSVGKLERELVTLRKVKGVS